MSLARHLKHLVQKRDKAKRRAYLQNVSEGLVKGPMRAAHDNGRCLPGCGVCLANRIIAANSKGKP